ncbi:MAG: sulfatase [bacterium]|nr:sulfatase [bacterium]
MRRRFSLAGMLLLLVGAGAAAVWWSRRLPDVVVVVVDTLRADRLGAYGNPRGLTPYLDALATDGGRFARAWSASSWTNPAVASLFTSRYPTEHGVGRYDSRLPAEEVTLAERLGEAGYIRLGFTANLRLTEELGFAQGFQAWFPYVGDGDKPRVGRLVHDALALIDELKIARGPFWRRWVRPPLFLYLQFMEPHGPYLPPEPWRSRFGTPPPPGATDRSVNDDMIDPSRWSQIDEAALALLESLYDGEVAALDAGLLPLFTGLRERGFLRDGIVVVTADHGEEFREHGFLGHGTSLYDEQLRIPLLMQVPRGRAGVVVEEPVSLVDVAPTLLDLLGLAPEPRFEGRSLAPALYGHGVGRRDLLAELLPNSPKGDMGRHDAALVRWPAKILLDRRRPDGSQPVELYDLANDPGEHHDDPATLRPERNALLAAMQAWRMALGTRMSLHEQGTVTPEMQERLRALGYAH